MSGLISGWQVVYRTSITSRFATVVTYTWSKNRNGINNGYRIQWRVKQSRHIGTPLRARNFLVLSFCSEGTICRLRVEQVEFAGQICRSDLQVKKIINKRIIS